MRIGIFSSFIERDALTLVKAVQDSVNTGEVPNSEISFIFSNRDMGENETSDIILRELSSSSIPLITFSAARFKPVFRQAARGREKVGHPTLIKEWRSEYGEEVMKRLPQTDIDLLLGDMWIWGDNMARDRIGVNLHPALPNGPKGEWYNVNWKLIEEKKAETGVMMHRVTSELDRGPAVTYCRFPIVGQGFDKLWEGLPQDKERFDQMIAQGLAGKERGDHPLFRKIREEGFRREIPLIIQTAKAFAEGRVHAEGDLIVDGNWQILQEGYDLTPQIEQMIKPNLEGQTARKEVRS